MPPPADSAAITQAVFLVAVMAWLPVTDDIGTEPSGVDPVSGEAIPTGNAAGVTQAYLLAAVPVGGTAAVSQAVLLVAVPADDAEPLLNPDGTTALRPEWPVALVDQHAVLASGGREGRHTREAHERRPRRYSLRVRLGWDPDVQVLRKALSVSRGGVLPLRWRHPVDDPAGPVGSAPFWRIVNGGDGEIALLRAVGGATGDFNIVIEEI